MPNKTTAVDQLISNQTARKSAGSGGLTLERIQSYGHTAQAARKALAHYNQISGGSKSATAGLKAAFHKDLKGTAQAAAEKAAATRAANQSKGSKGSK